MVEERVIQYVAENPSVTAGVVIGVLTVVVNYAKTGKFPIGRLPYRYLRRMWSDVRDQHFGRDRPRGVPGIIVDMEPSEMDDSFRPLHYENGELFSYEYEGEVFNIRRPDGFEADPTTGEPVAMENHIRGFELDDGRTLLLPHYEPNRFTETGHHFDAENFSWDRGVEKTTTDLDALGIGYERVESERAADLSVVP